VWIDFGTVEHELLEALNAVTFCFEHGLVKDAGGFTWVGLSAAVHPLRELVFIDAGAASADTSSESHAQRAADLDGEFIANRTALPAFA